MSSARRRTRRSAGASNQVGPEGKSPEALDPVESPESQEKTRRLGAVLRAHRIEQAISAADLAKQSGLSRSYVNYLESGKFAEVGLEKFARVVEALGLSADRVLREAGYLPSGPENLPDPRTYLATVGLSAQSAEQALAFVEFLASREGGAPLKASRRGKKA